MSCNRRWRQRATELVVDTPWFRLRADDVELPSARTLSPFYVMEEPDWVHVVAFVDSDTILTVTKYRYAADTLCLELPGGYIETGESPLNAARRELLEETGYSSDDWQLVATMFSNPARSTNKTFVFVAQGVVASAPITDNQSQEIDFSTTRIAEVPLGTVEPESFSQALHTASLYMALRSISTQGS